MLSLGLGLKTKFFGLSLGLGLAVSGLGLGRGLAFFGLGLELCSLVNITDNLLSCSIN